ncbi:zinc finger protein 40 isoform X2 [Ascaphus truei]|uniref:zinc finger protein 40 isoform X2 n=1 Tax=Ascaphus truei TaxID=8439 RepID=UPI003F59CD85
MTRPQLLDKIEEAQKELNSPDEPQKEILDVGSRCCSDAVKGVKRKKIVTENHLKKIPKSPLRNASKEKQRHDIKAFTALSTYPTGSGSSKDKELLLVPKSKQNTRQSKGGDSSELIAESVKRVLMQAKKHSVPPDLCNGRSEDYDFGNKLTLSGKRSTSSSLPSNQKSASIHFENTRKSSSCANSAFDVLLKAMEPELNTLTQSWPPCGTQTEKQGLNTIPAPSASTASNPSSLSQHEFSARSLYYHCAGHSGQLCMSVKGAQHAQMHSSSEQRHSETGLQKQQPSSCPRFSSSLDATRHQPVYRVAVTSSIVPPSSSTVSQVLPLPGNSSSSTNHSKLSTNSTYSLAQVASLLSGEQMCNIVLKDQKPKKQGKYICEYCNRACAKPSVLLKHIRSHTGERPYPCVTCGFSFKTKSNLYKHKKSHAHAIKLGLGLRPDSGGMLLSHDSEKALCIHSDVDESGESDDDYTSEERQEDQNLPGIEGSEIVDISSDSEAMSQKEGKTPSHSPDAMLHDTSLREKSAEARLTALPKVVIYPVNVSPLRADSPKVLESTSEHFIAQMPEFRTKNKNSNVLQMRSLSEIEHVSPNKCELVQIEDKHPTNVVTSHAQLQRQQATDCSQEQQNKCLLSPRSLGSTDSGYFSRSESADQAMSPPTPFLRLQPTSDKDFSKNVSSMPHTGIPVSPMIQPVYAEKPTIITGTMRPPSGTRTLEERISKLISDNEAVVDDKQLDSVKPRRTSLSRRGSIDSPKSYIFKDSFQFDLNPVGRRTSSSSDIPKSPFTPTDKSKQVFFLSVPSQFPSIDCLPITRSNSMPTTGYSAVPAVIPASHPLRGSQSFDEKIGSFYDDVFVSGPATPQQIVHPRTLVRQAAVEDTSTTEHCGLGPARSVDETYPGSKASPEVLLPRSKSFVLGSSLDRIKKTHLGRGTMFECETCRNRYRKLENFENHKKFYCSELHGPKSKTVARETEHNSTPNSSQSQILHYRVASSTGTLEQPLQFRKRRKMKSVGDDDEPQQSEGRTTSENVDALNRSGTNKTSSSITILVSQSCSVLTLSPQIQLVPRSTDTSTDVNPTTEKNTKPASQEKVELKRQGTGISVIQHTNSLSRPNSFEKSESIERVSPVPFYELNKTSVPHTLNAVGVIHEERSAHHSSSQNSPSRSIEIPRLEVHESQKVASTDRAALVTQSRLVRQHNIQVPEILVTEEPDKEPENQLNDQEPQDKFSWPQHRGSLSSLPTEKLPPKKKRIRLADLEYSSAESSFDSTLSRSLSRESSLSRASSFSASFDKEESSKSESSTKVDVVNKSSEFLTIPTGLTTFGVPREMRRAASEQINCTQPSMEVTDYRSKSFDCGSMFRSRSMSPTNIMTPKSTTCTVNIGHVPLLERRRGPLVKQISLNIGPESSVSQTKSKLLKNLQSENPTLSQPNLQTINRSLTEVKLCSREAANQKSVSEPHLSIQNSNLPSVPPIQHSVCSGSANTSQPPLLNRDYITCIQNSTKGEDQDKNIVSLDMNEKRDCFAPKYQLRIQKIKESQSCTSKPVITILPNRTPTGTINEAHSSISLNLTSDLIDILPNLCTTHQKLNISDKSSGKFQNTREVVVPVHNYSDSLYYGFPSITALPEILVTQDQGNQIVYPKDKTLMPKSHEEPTRLLPSSHKTSIYESCFLESVCRKLHSTESPTSLQKVPVAGLLPQQETSASSKRMLSPANSLDIAMEKHQKRVKDESGAACNISSQQVNLLSMKSGEPGKHKKPMLVRQLCTTDPSESLDQEVILTPGKNGQESSSLNILSSDLHSSKKGNAAVSENIKEEVENEKNKSFEPSYSAIRTSPESSLVYTKTCVLKSIYSSQERKSPAATKTVHIQGQVQLAAAISMVNMGDMHRLSFPSLSTSTSFTWCYLLKRKPLHLPQNDQKISSYASWDVNSNNPNPLGLSTKVALSLLNSKQKSEKFIFTPVITSHARRDIVVYSSKWKNSAKKISHDKSDENQLGDQENSETSADQDKDPFLNKSEPRRVKIFDGGYKSNEEYVYVRGRGRGKYICEECGIRCKKPSMLKKHIRTHTDVRPYHCNYCNFSFKTKGNLTKHMKSKAHSKKCMDMGVAVGLMDEQDTDDSGERQRFSGERSGCDADDSDGQEDDDNDNDDEDDDSQAESVLSATPSVTASPQHYPFRNSHQEISSADEDVKIPHGFAQTNSMDILPTALITRMTALTTTTRYRPESHTETCKEGLLPKAVGPHSEESSPKSLCHQMSVDYPYAEEVLESSSETKPATVSNNSSVNIPSSPVDRSTQTMDSCANPTDCKVHQQHAVDSTQQPTQVGPPQTHLFSHLPLHSQQPVRAPYSMIPVGGIQLVPAGLSAYSTFVPFQAGPVQLTIPAVGIIHRTTSALGDKAGEVPSKPSPIGVAEVNGVLPCFPVGQINVPGLSAPSLQPIQSLSMETLNILGLTNTTLTPQIHPSGLTLNAVGLQVLTTSPAPQNNPNPQAHIPGLQILNIALPTLIPCISPLTVESQGALDKSPSCNAASCQGPSSFPVADTKNKQTDSPQGSPRMQEYHANSSDSSITEEKHTVWPTTAEKVSQVKHHSDMSSNRVKTSSTPDIFLKVHSEGSSKYPVCQTLSPLTYQRRRELVSRQNTVQFSDASSDEDEDRLVIAT